MRLPAGQRLGAFEIVSLLGVGGMGEVYRARDSRLHREVAIKVLPQSVAADAGRLARFEREARTLAALDHPNIAPVFDFQEAEGSHFLVMQLIEGPTLADRLKRGPLPVEEALGLFVEIADGMAAAHDQGIIHRDLKPANLKIDNRGRARILDFGLAKAFEAAEGDRDHTGTLAMSEDSAGRTGEGQVLGTPAYMSPEQARGQAVDRRADVWAFGICLYETLSGRRPFHGETASDLLADILRGEPDWSALPRGLPSHLQSLIRRCLEKNPRRRYSSLADIALTLEEAASDWKKSMRGEAETVLPASPPPAPRFQHPVSPPPASPSTPTPSGRTPFGPPTPTPSSEIARLINRIVVLPFDNLMGDPNQEHFVDGMTESLSIELSKMSGVEVISHNSAMHYKRSSKMPRQIARELGVEGLLCGAIMRAGDDIRITVRIIDGKSDRQVWADQYDGKHAQILSLQKQAALAVAEQISTTLTLEDRLKAINVPDVNPEAHNAYLLGRHFAARQSMGSLEIARKHYEKALALDPGYALAHAGMAEIFATGGAYGAMRASRAFSLARDHAIRATQLDSTLGTGYALHAHALMFLGQDWAEVARLLRRAMELSPRDPGVLELQSRFLGLMGRHEEAIRTMETACEIDPLSAVLWHSRAGTHYLARDFETSIRHHERALLLEPGLIHAMNARTYNLIGLKRYEQAVASAEEVVRLFPGDLSGLANIPLVHAYAGRRDEALRALPGIKHAHSTRALVYTALGDHESALHELELSLEEVDWPLLIVSASCMWDPLRREPRFRAVLRKLNFPDDVDRDLLPPDSRRRPSSSESPTSGTTPEISSAAAPNRLVVLPFDNLMGDPNQEHFVDGMTEALSIELSKMPGVEVISHTSAMRFKGTKTPHADIASQLGVGTLVAGSIMRAGGDIRIAVRLIDGRTERQMWGDRYEGKHAKILSLQGEVALAVAEQVSSELTHGDRQKVANAPVVNPEAHEAWLLARHFARRRTSADLRRALEQYERAIGIDPGYAAAYAGLSEIYLLMDFYGIDLARKPLRLSRDAALRALELDPRSADACRVLASSRFFLDRDAEEADRLYRKAIELAPDDAQAYRSRGNALSLFGRFDEGRKALEKACRLDPLNGIHWMFRSLAEFRPRRFEDSLKWCDHALMLEPTNANALNQRTHVLLALGRFEEANHMADVLRDSGTRDAYLLRTIAHVYAFTGRKDDARAVLGRVLADEGQDHQPKSALSLIYLGLGETDAALDLLERSLDEQDALAITCGYGPEWDLVRRHPRFRAIRRKFGFIKDDDLDLLPPESKPASAPSTPRPDRAFASADPASRKIEKLAVLPFSSIAEDDSQDWLVDGVTEALITELGKIRSLDVISRSTAMRFKHSKLSAPEIARELDVDALVEGSVQRVGAEIRIQARLVDPHADRQLWADDYDGEMKAILKLQKEVALSIVREIKAAISPSEVRRIRKAHEVHPQAYELYLKAKHCYYKVDRESMERSRRLSAEAISIDPGFAAGHAFFAQASTGFASTHGDIRDVAEEIDIAARRALELDPDDAMAHNVTAWHAMLVKQDWDRAEREFRRAIELNPGLPEGYNGLAWYFHHLGYFEEAVQARRGAVRVDPLNTFWRVWLTRDLESLGRFEDALAEAREVLELEPGNAIIRSLIAETLLALGRAKEAMEYIAEANSRSGKNPYGIGVECEVLVALGRRDEAAAIVADMEERSRRESVQSAMMARAHMALGQVDQAYTWLERAIRRGATGYLHIHSESFKPLVSQPRFRALLDELGYPGRRPEGAMAAPPSAAAPSAESKPDPRSAPPRDSQFPAHSITKLAVLPFTSIAKDSSEDWFIDGVTESVITEMSKIRSLTVISRASAMHFKSSSKPARTIAMELGVDALIEGSVLRAGEKVRIQVRLIDPASDSQRWADAYEGDLDGILDLIKQVSLAVAHSIRAKLSPIEVRRLSQSTSVNREAYECFLRGRHLVYRYDAESLQEACALLERAIELEPGFADAHAFLANAYMSQMWVHVRQTPEFVNRMKAAAQKALQLDANNAPGQIVAGMIALLIDWNWTEAERRLFRALEINSGIPDIHFALKYYYGSLGRFEEAIHAQEQAILLDPLNPMQLETLGEAYFEAGQFERALQIQRDVLEVDPDNVLAHWNLIACLVMLGRYQEASAAISHAVGRFGPSPLLGTLQAHVDHETGHEKEALQIVDEMLDRYQHDRLPATHVLFAYAAVGNREQAFFWLEKAFQERDPLLAMPHMGFHRFWGDQRYEALLDRMNYPGIRPRPPKGGWPFEKQRPVKPPDSVEGNYSPRFSKLAVLPFTSIAKDDSEDWLTDGMTELLITELGKVKSLTVISRTSAMRYKRSEKPLTEIARELNVDALVEGSVIRMGNDVQITARLIDGRSDQRLWGDFFSGKFEDILRLQGEVTLSIAREVKATVSPEEAARVENAPRVVSAAYESFLRARVLAADQNTKGFERAAALLEHAIRIDPGFAEAHAELANLLADQMGWCLKSVAEVRERCMNAARKAMALAPGSSFAHHALGSAMRHSTWNQEDLERDFKRAIELDPGNILAHVKMIWFLAPYGRFEDARAHGKKALDLDPFSGLAWWSAGMVAVFAREFDEAIRMFRKGLEVDPDYVAMQSWLGVSLMMKGETGAALPLVRRGVEMTEPEPSPHLLTNLGFVLHRSGDEAGARSILGRLIAQHEAGSGSNSHIAMLHGELGELDAAMDWLTRDFEAGEWVASWLKTYALYDPLRGDPRFLALVRRFELSL